MRWLFIRPLLFCQRLATIPLTAWLFSGRIFLSCAGESRNVMKSRILVVIINLVMGSIFIYGIWQVAHSPSVASDVSTTQPSPSSRSLPPDVAFSSLGASNTFRPNSWPIRSEGHADWFVSKASGRLSMIEMAIEPAGSQAGNLTVFIAGDGNGFPGKVLESFQVAVYSNTAGSLVFTSVTQPALEAGEKYWVCARTPGGWQWHFNDQNMMQNAARGTKRGRWATAGYCAVCAFRVTIATNQPSTMTVDRK